MYYIVLLSAKKTYEPLCGVVRKFYLLMFPGNQIDDEAAHALAHGIEVRIL